jgi:hypothetical protein
MTPLSNIIQPNWPYCLCVSAFSAFKVTCASVLMPLTPNAYIDGIRLSRSQPGWPGRTQPSGPSNKSARRPSTIYPSRSTRLPAPRRHTCSAPDCRRGRWDAGSGLRHRIAGTTPGCAGQWRAGHRCERRRSWRSGAGGSLAKRCWRPLYRWAV